MPKRSSEKSSGFVKIDPKHLRNLQLPVSKKTHLKKAKGNTRKKRPKKRQKHKLARAAIGQPLSARERDALDSAKKRFVREYKHIFISLNMESDFDRCVEHITGDIFRNIIGNERLESSSQLINAERTVQKFLCFFVYSSPTQIYRKLNEWTRQTIPNIFPPALDGDSHKSPWNRIIYAMLYAWMDTHGYRKIVKDDRHMLYYRGDSHMRALDAGDYFFCEQFWSSSDNIDVATMFAGNGIVYNIRDAAGVLPLPIESISMIPDEKEYIFPPGTVFQVTRKTGNNPTMIHLETLGFSPEVNRPILHLEYDGFISLFQYKSTIPRSHMGQPPAPEPEPEPEPVPPPQNIATSEDTFSLFSWSSALAIGSVAAGIASIALLGSKKKIRSRTRRKRRRKGRKGRSNK